jgi:hypothetical protein
MRWCAAHERCMMAFVPEAAAEIRHAPRIR